MKLQRSTGALLGIAIALVTTVAIIETTKNTQPNSGETLYQFTEDDINAFTINRDDTILSFIKTDDTWQMTEPQKATADPAAVAFLLNIITSDPIQEKILADSEQLEAYGLTSPAAVIEMNVYDDESHTLTIGEDDFSGTSLYALTDAGTPDDENADDENTDTDPDVNVYLLSKDLENGIERSIEDWIAAESSETDATDNPGVEPQDASAETTNSDSDSPELPQTIEPLDDIETEDGANTSIGEEDNDT